MCKAMGQAGARTKETAMEERTEEGVLLCVFFFYQYVCYQLHLNGSLKLLVVLERGQVVPQDGRFVVKLYTWMDE